jgi:outer membrane lipoprotein-sorting protein
VEATQSLLRTVTAHEAPDDLPRKMLEATRAARSKAIEARKGKRMKRLVLCAAIVVILAAVAYALTHHASVPASDLRRALLGVSTMHITGEAESGFMSGTKETDIDDARAYLPLALRKDKWLRREPYAMFEETTPVKPSPLTAPNGRYILASYSERCYWYFPSRANRVLVTRPMRIDLADEVMLWIRDGGSEGENTALRVVGHDRINGHGVVLVALDGARSEVELAVDESTKLTYRARLFRTSAKGNRVEATRFNFEYDKQPPTGVFDWQPPAGAPVVDRRQRR